MRIVTTSEIEPASLPLSAQAGVDSVPLLSNPFRTPEILQNHRASRVKAFLRAARGASLWGVDTKVLLWLVVHVASIAALYACTDQLPALVRAGLGHGGAAWTWPRARALLAAAELALLAALYASLYASDPGWLHDKLAVTARGGAHCNYCGCAPSARSKHSKNTGQCVHKFDHFCWLLATDVGDRNHRRFWLYLLLQVLLLCWALRMVVSSSLVCLGADAPHRCADAALVAGALGLALLFLASLAFFGYLLLLHTYLVATNQTTYEVIRGAKYPALAAAYQRHPGRRCYPLPRALPHLLWDELRGRGPPKPFSLGVAGNLRQFFFESWPRHYGREPPGLAGSKLAKRAGSADAVELRLLAGESAA